MMSLLKCCNLSPLSPSLGVTMQLHAARDWGMDTVIVLLWKHIPPLANGFL